MSARKAKLLFLLLIVLVTLLFFFHNPQGGFQSKNGPTTPINNLRFVIAGLLLLLAGKWLSASLLTLADSTLTGVFTVSPSPFPAMTCSTSLRC
jgi:hypothetical protein